MIKKDILPDVWTDQWQLPSDTKPLVYNVPAHEALRVIECSEIWLKERFRNEAEVIDPTDLVEINIGEDAHVEFYRLEGMCTEDIHLTHTKIVMQRGASLKMNTVTLGGQHVRNNVEIRMKGEGCSVQADGIYLIDREQECDNYIFVEHTAPNCTSSELYKGIIDDAAKARFNGHVLVQGGATKTEAAQTNRNILLTGKAHVDTRPFLEIYNDDVKCSHGSTIGRLDEQAMFYLRSRGITERTAMTMLSYAFCDEVIRHIGIESLRDVVADMVKKRLHGELTSCEDCAIKCSTPCNGPDVNFEIDPEKL